MLDKFRYVGVSAGSLRFVDTYRRGSAPNKVTVWTLPNPDAPICALPAAAGRHRSSIWCSHVQIRRAWGSGAVPERRSGRGRGHLRAPCCVHRTQACRPAGDCAPRSALLAPAGAGLSSGQRPRAQGAGRPGGKGAPPPCTPRQSTEAKPQPEAVNCEV